MPTDPTQSESTYFIDAENVAEMARLMKQDRLVTKNMGGLFPEQSDLSKIHDVLDIACGPGGWVIDVARTYPEMQVVGIDISRIMVEYAHSLALSQRLTNASFRMMDVLKPLEFPDNSFDLVNARFMIGFMSKAAWPDLVRECLRILRPGGIIRLTEFEPSLTNSPAFEKLGGIITETLRLAGRSFSPDGRNLGITPMLGWFLRNAGCINVRRMAHVIDYSFGMETHHGFYQDYLVFFKLLQPFLIKAGTTTQEELETLYHQTLSEILQDDFCALDFFLTVWGEKPAEG